MINCCVGNVFLSENKNCLNSSVFIRYTEIVYVWLASPANGFAVGTIVCKNSAAISVLPSTCWLALPTLLLAFCVASSLMLWFWFRFEAPVCAVFRTGIAPPTVLSAPEPFTSPSCVFSAVLSIEVRALVGLFRLATTGLTSCVTSSNS